MRPFQQEESVRTLGAEGLFLFSSLDTDHDLYLSPEEFKPIAEKLTGTARFLSLNPFSSATNKTPSVSLVTVNPALILIPVASSQELHPQWILRRK